MHIQSIRTSVVSLDENLEVFLDTFLPALENKDIVFITSKIVSLAGGWVVPKETISKLDLIRQQADAYVEGQQEAIQLTIKHHMLIPSAGIDESNAQGDYYILFPPHPFEEVQKIYTYLTKRHQLKDLGVIMTDSHTSPLRRGVTGIALAWHGLRPCTNRIGDKDLFGRPLKMTMINVVDALATAAVLTMGEGAEQCPLALVRHASFVEFTDEPTLPGHEFFISPEDDIYKPLLSHGKWVWNK